MLDRYAKAGRPGAAQDFLFDVVANFLLKGCRLRHGSTGIQFRDGFPVAGHDPVFLNMPPVLDEFAAVSPDRTDEGLRSREDQAAEQAVALPAGEYLRPAIDRHDIRRQSFGNTGGHAQSLRATKASGV